jgi:diadenosine tetraphosphate (Ap4A) HIT family hydrolase
VGELINTFRNKFRCAEFELWRGQGWCLSLRPDQLTYGSMVLSVLDDSTRFSDINSAHAAGFLAGLRQAEKLAIDVFGAQKVNYLALMMVDPVVHFHIFPRYSESFNKHGQEWNDGDYPGPIRVGPAPTDEPVLQAIWKDLAGHVSIEDSSAVPPNAAPEWLLKQLFHAQEQLNHHYMRETSAQDELGRLRARNMQLQTSNTQLKSQIAALQDERVLTSVFSPFIRLARRGKSALMGGVGRRFRLKQHVALVRTSDYFDEQWYLSQYPDIRKEGVDPALHYVAHGGQEGRNPSPRFDSARYLSRYPDVANSGENPLVHYLTHGRAEGRTP